MSPYLLPSLALAAIVFVILNIGLTYYFMECTRKEIDAIEEIIKYLKNTHKSLRQESQQIEKELQHARKSLLKLSRHMSKIDSNIKKD